MLIVHGTDCKSAPTEAEIVWHELQIRASGGGKYMAWIANPRQQRQKLYGTNCKFAPAVGKRLQILIAPIFNRC